jgi:MYXO-CTERM domain-containing protein
MPVWGKSLNPLTEPEPPGGCRQGMSRSVIAPVLVAVLALAPAAAAKGPHAVVSSGPEGVDPGKPWVTTLAFVEYGHRAAAAHPRVILRSRGERFTVEPKPIAADARYRLRVVFPRAGRWSYTVLDGTPADRRFRFPAVSIGDDVDRVPRGYVAFPQGSHAAAQGAGGPVFGDAGPAADEPGDVLPPEVVLPPENRPDDGGFAVWIPLAGLALAGVGTLTVLRRRR